MTIIETGPGLLPRCHDTPVQDRHRCDEWETALRPLDASHALDQPQDSFGVSVTHDADTGAVPLHVPRPGSARGYDGGDEAVGDQRIRETLPAAAVALLLS